MRDGDKKRTDWPDPLNPWELGASLMMCAVAFSYMAGPEWGGHPHILAGGALAAMGAALGRQPSVPEMLFGSSLTAAAYAAGQAGTGSAEAATLLIVAICSALWAWADGRGE